LREARLGGTALQLFHERERAEALLDQLLDGTQLGEQRLLALQRGRGVEVRRRLGGGGRGRRDRRQLRRRDVGDDDVVGEAEVGTSLRAGARRSRGRRGGRRGSRGNVVAMGLVGVAGAVAASDAWRRRSMRVRT
jgi:hypothetical protein